MLKNVAPRRVLLSVLCLLQVAFLAGVMIVRHQSSTGHLIGSDGIFYYEYLPSIFVDHDLDFSNQRALLKSEGVQYPWHHPWLQPNAQGMSPTPFTVGWALLTAPFFLLAQALALLVGPAFGLRQDGYGLLAEGLASFGAALYGCIGCWLVYRTLARWWSDALAALTALLLLLLTNLAYYIVVQPTMSHAVGVFSIAAALHAAVRWIGTPAGAAGPGSPAHPPEPSAWWQFGLWAGVAILVRPQWLLAVVGLYAWLLLVRHPITALFRAAIVTIAVALIQSWIWYRISGQPFSVPQGDGFLKYANPELLAVLFSLRHGLITWHPLYGVALIGLVLGALRAAPAPRQALRLLCIVSIGVFIAEWYVNAIVNDWWAANSFGHRRFIDLLPLLAPGLAFVLAGLTTSRTGRLAVGAVAGVLLVWNLLFTVQYRFGYIPRAETITWQQLTIDKFRLPWLPRPYK